MKKKHRDIEVDGVQYAWIARENGTVTIWKDKKPICEDTVYAGDVAVIPPMVKHAIRILHKHPDQKGIIHLMTEIAYHTQEAEALKLRWKEATQLMFAAQKELIKIDK